MLAEDYDTTFALSNYNFNTTPPLKNRKSSNLQGGHIPVKSSLTQLRTLSRTEVYTKNSGVCAEPSQVNKDSLNLSPLFAEFDRFNIGDVTEAGMERALGVAHLLPPEPIFRALVKKFREHSRNNSGGEVNYKAFITAVSESAGKSNTYQLSCVGEAARKASLLSRPPRREGGARLHLPMYQS